MYLCALYPVSAESVQLNLEFEEAEDVVFSVLGPRSVFLTGFYMRGGQHDSYPFLDLNFGLWRLFMA